MRLTLSILASISAGYALPMVETSSNADANRFDQAVQTAGNWSNAAEQRLSIFEDGSLGRGLLRNPGNGRLGKVLPGNGPPVGVPNNGPPGGGPFKGIAQCRPFSDGMAPPIDSFPQLLQLDPRDAPYDMTREELLASISFPNGFECRKNLVILVPGTAVPATDTFSSTFIPVFKDANTANADVLLVNSASISLGDIATTAELVAFAINYANLVLGRRATVLAWSQGNLNTQWALKYWPSARTNTKNYAAMSPDYDGTLDASFLCNPEELLVQNVPQITQDFLQDNGLGASAASVLGVTRMPSQANQFKLLLLEYLSGSQNLNTIISFVTSLPSNVLNTLGARRQPKRFVLSASQPVAGSPGQAQKRRREIGSPSSMPLQQLVKGLQSPIQQAIASLGAKPGSVLQQVLSNQANLVGFDVPAVIPQGCLPSIWQQTYFSNFVQTLAQDFGNGAGDTALVPTTTVYSLFDEVVQPQGFSGMTSASGFLKGASNIFIQGPQSGGCPVLASTIRDGLPTVITHEGVLFSGMGVEVGILAVRNGGQVQVNQVSPELRCLVVSPRLNAVQALAQTATIPGALARVLLGDGTTSLAGGFLAAEPAVKSYASRRF